MKLNSIRYHNTERKNELIEQIVYKNGRQVKRKNFNEADKLSDQLGLVTCQKVSKRFAFLPTLTTDGLLWLQTYWSFSEENDENFYITKIRSENKDSLADEITKYRNARYSKFLKKDNSRRDEFYQSIKSKFSKENCKGIKNDLEAKNTNHLKKDNVIFVDFNRK